MAWEEISFVSVERLITTQGIVNTPYRSAHYVASVSFTNMENWLIESSVFAILFDAFKVYIGPQLRCDM